MIHRLTLTLKPVKLQRVYLAPPRLVRFPSLNPPHRPLNEEPQPPYSWHPHLVPRSPRPLRRFQQCHASFDHKSPSFEPHMGLKRRRRGLRCCASIVGFDREGRTDNPQSLQKCSSSTLPLPVSASQYSCIFAFSEAHDLGGYGHEERGPVYHLFLSTSRLLNSCSFLRLSFNLHPGGVRVGVGGIKGEWKTGGGTEA